jgi:hypothetical protein
MKRLPVLMAVVGLLLFAYSAFGQTVVPMTFTGWDGDSWDNGGTGFYYGSVNGTAVGPGNSSPGYFCDDFNDEIYIPESWQAHAFQVSTLLENWSTYSSDVLFGGAFSGYNNVGQTGYLEMAILVEASFSGTLGNIFAGATANDISAALWCITGGPGSACSQGNMSAASWALWQYVLNNHNGVSLSQFANLWLYVPINGSQSQGGQPQEMWGNVAVPEGGDAWMYLLLAGVTCFGAMFYSRSQRTKRVMA